jgi:hypothetical protein
MAMNIDDLQYNADHATQTLHAVRPLVKELLDSDAPDSVKKSVLIEYLATYEVEVQFMRDDLIKYIDEQKQKKFWQRRK